MPMSYSNDRWKPAHGVIFTEPIRKRDEKLFTKAHCNCCNKDFWVARELKPVPQVCEGCFLDGLSAAKAPKPEPSRIHKPFSGR